ncbi:hypothetical protein Tco_0123333 [Tanacetum coccineum]
MDQDSAHMVAASKVSMLKPGEYEIWRMRIEQYIQMIDYALWEVIENGATLPKKTMVEGVMTVMPITTAEEKAQRRLEVKARSTLMMGIPNEHQLKFNSIKDAKSPVCWSEVEDSQLTGLELIRDTTEKIVQIKNLLLTARSRQKSYADRRTKPLDFKFGDMVLLKVSPWKGTMYFGKCGKLSPHYIGLFKILARVGPVVYTLELPKELKGIHSTFHVSNLKKCLAEGDIVVLMDEIQLDDKLHMIEEPVEVIDREVKQLKQSQIPIVKFHWNSQRGPEFTWEREDLLKKSTSSLYSKDEGEEVDKVELSSADGAPKGGEI